MDRECKECGASKPLEGFSPSGLFYKDGGQRRHTVCKICENRLRVVRYRLKKAHAPPEACENCGRLSKVQLDHDHLSGHFRGWLCRECNLGLGKIGDSLAAAEQLVAHLKRYEPS